MFAARCVGVSLAMFVLAYVLGSLAVWAGWRLLMRLLRPVSAHATADLLFAIRIFPLGLALTTTLGVALPSFLLLEPHATDEAVGTAPLVLAAVFLGLTVWGVWGAVRSQRRTSRAMEQWLDGSTRMDLPDCVPVFRSHQPSPTLTVAGVCAPKVIVSDDAATVLTATELRTALRHEVAHVRRYDNLKKLIFRVAAFPGAAALEAAWADQTELAADDAAVSSLDDALDLASALIKVSRLGFGATAELSRALLHSSTALTIRIRRLFAWSGSREAAPARSIWFCGVSMVAVLACLIAGYNAMLGGMHELTEWLVR